MILKFFVAKDETDGQPIVAMQHEDHYHVANNCDGDTKEQVAEWLKHHLTPGFIMNVLMTWPERDESEVSELELALETDDGM